MPRIRKYRTFVISAVVILFLLHRISQNAQLDAQPVAVYQDYSAPADAKPASAPSSEPPAKAAAANGGATLPASAPVPAPLRPLEADLGVGSVPPAAASKQAVVSIADPMTASPPPPLFAALATTASSSIASSSTSTTIHWQKPREFYPLPEKSVMALPTGAPKPIPRIQHVFKAENETARVLRESRLAAVRGEMAHAFSGYRVYAWAHDELKPVSKEFRDPFCGWAATLVDSLDTLWIMGMYDEFDEAYQAVLAIDFTTTPFRTEIPVFETIIRYLGGLIAAYDVSGGAAGKYAKLLVKAEELAEILMGIFDTPNRMPILYYGWQPQMASQPRHASTAASVAELGSMSMEFTRLAQLTGKNRYYDATARITDAFEEWQNRADTALPGIFPERVDASGCNRSAVAAKQLSGASKAAQEQAAAAKDLDREPVGYEPVALSGEPVTADDGDTVAPVSGVSQPGKRAVIPPSASPVAAMAKEPDSSTAAEATTATASPVNKGAGRRPPAGGIPHHHGASSQPVQANGEVADWDCVPQNLTASAYGAQSYSMGGSQDSTYEYFPKQYLLLGGLVPKYRTMHEKVIAAVKKHLLFRPMIKDEARNLLFSARVNVNKGEWAYTYEVTHLTCFLGGMLAMGGRIFDSPEEVELGARLADGCAWAYEVMPTGIMPEFSIIVPCDNTTSCPWNETKWYEQLDPSAAWRESETQLYLDRVAEWKEKKAQVLELQELRRQIKQSVAPSVAVTAPQAEAAGAQAVGAAGALASGTPMKTTTTFTKRAVADELPKPAAGAKDANIISIENKIKALEAHLNIDSTPVNEHFGGTLGSVPAPPAEPAASEKALEDYIPPEPTKPVTHREFVETRIANERIPPGFSGLHDRRYILRPEAIESVWYMYRITGDPIWQERGWRMYQSVINATKTSVGHSAIGDVTAADRSEITQTDYMESFWFAETLKYFYLLFAKPDVISLDEWVFNTEAHPFRRPT